MILHGYNYRSSGQYPLSVFYVKNKVLVTGFCLRLQGKPTQLSQIELVSVTGPPE
jgi:hypothetical protein